MNISATNKNLHWHHQDGRSDKCPCCTIHVETAEHVILCPAVGRVEAFMQASRPFWLEEANTDPDLIDCIVDYVQSRGVGVYTAGVLAHWCTGVLAYWHTGVLAYWRSGVLAYWRTGVMV
jgi:hypothetical protein